MFTKYKHWLKHIDEPVCDQKLRDAIQDIVDKTQADIDAINVEGWRRAKLMVVPAIIWLGSLVYLWMCK